MTNDEQISLAKNSSVQSPPTKKNAKQPVSIKEAPDVLGIIPCLLLTLALPKTTHFPSPE